MGCLKVEFEPDRRDAQTRALFNLSLEIAGPGQNLKTGATGAELVNPGYSDGALESLYAEALRREESGGAEMLRGGEG